MIPELTHYTPNKHRNGIRVIQSKEFLISKYTPSFKTLHLPRHECHWKSYRTRRLLADMLSASNLYKVDWQKLMVRGICDTQKLWNLLYKQHNIGNHLPILNLMIRLIKITLKSITWKISSKGFQVDLASFAWLDISPFCVSWLGSWITAYMFIE